MSEFKTTFDDTLKIPFDYTQALNISNMPMLRAFGYTGQELDSNQFFSGPTAPIEGYVWYRGNQSRSRSMPTGEYGIVDSVRHSAAAVHDGDFLTLLRSADQADSDFETMIIDGYLWEKSPNQNATIARQPPAPLGPSTNPPFPWEVQKTVTIAEAKKPTDSISLVVQGMDNDRENLVTIGSWQGLLAAPRRNAQDTSTLIAEVGANGEYDRDRIGALNDFVSIEPDENGDQKVAENWDRSNGLIRQGDVNGYMSSFLGGILGLGSGARDIHNIGVNSDGDSIGVVHLHLNAPWWHPRGDGFPDVDITPLINDKTDGPVWKTFFRPGPNIWAWQTNVPIGAVEDELVHVLNPGGLGLGPPPSAGSTGRPVSGGGLDNEEEGEDEEREPKGQGPCPLVIPEGQSLFGSDPVETPGPSVLITPDPAFVPLETGQGEEVISFVGNVPQVEVQRPIPVIRLGVEPCPRPGAVDTQEKSSEILDRPKKQNIRNQVINYSEIVQQSGSFRALDCDSDNRYQVGAGIDSIQESGLTPTIFRFDVLGVKPNGQFDRSGDNRYANGSVAGGHWYMAPNQDIDYIRAGQSLPDPDVLSYLGFHDVGIAFATPSEKSACGTSGLVMSFNREDDEFKIESIDSDGAVLNQMLTISPGNDSVVIGGSKLGFFNNDPIEKPNAYAVTGFEETRTIDAPNATIGQAVNFIATVLKDLTDYGLQDGTFNATSVFAQEAAPSVIEFDFDFNDDGILNIGSFAQGDLILYAGIDVDEGFDDVEAFVQLSLTPGGPSLLAPSDVDLGAVNTTATDDHIKLDSAKDLVLTLSSGTSTTGRGRVVVKTKRVQ